MVLQWEMKLNATKLMTSIDSTPSTFVLLSVSLWNDLNDPVFASVGLARFKSRANASLLAYSNLSFSLPLFSRFLPFVGVGGVVAFCLLECSCYHSLPCSADSCLLIIITIRNNTYSHHIRTSTKSSLTKHICNVKYHHRFILFNYSCTFTRSLQKSFTITEWGDQINHCFLCHAIASHFLRSRVSIEVWIVQGNWCIQQWKVPHAAEWEQEEELLCTLGSLLERIEIRNEREKYVFLRFFAVLLDEFFPIRSTFLYKEFENQTID